MRPLIRLGWRCASLRSERVVTLLWSNFCVAAYGARLCLFANPPLRLRSHPNTRKPRVSGTPVTLASGWANFATRLRRWKFGFFAFCRSDNSSLCRMKKRWMACACLQRSRSLTRASVSAGRIRSRATHGNCSRSAPEARDSGWHLDEGRRSGRAMDLARAGETVLVELPDAAWHRTKCREPSTQPHIPAVVRLSVGMTGGMGHR